MSGKRKLAYEVPGSERKTQKRNTAKLVALLVLLGIVLAILLPIFLKSYFGVVRLSSSAEGTNVIDRRKNIVYELAPACYQPVELYTASEYAKYKDKVFYKIGHTKGGVFIPADEKKYLSAPEYGFYDLYYNIEYELPVLSEFGATYALICKVGTTVIQTGTLTNDETALAIELLLKGEQVPYPSGIDSDTVLQLNIRSDEYGFLYYVISYFETVDGFRYLYDRSTGMCVNLGDNLGDALRSE